MPLVCNFEQTQCGFNTSASSHGMEWSRLNVAVGHTFLETDSTYHTKRQGNGQGFLLYILFFFLDYYNVSMSIITWAVVMVIESRFMAASNAYLDFWRSNISFQINMNRTEQNFFQTFTKYIVLLTYNTL